MAQADSDNSTTAPAPEKPQDALYYPTPVTPEQAFQAIGRLRKDARDEIDRLIQFLDKTDDYVSRELEPDGDDEPSLCGVTVERLIDDSDREADLGSFDRMVDQTKALRTADLRHETLGGWPVQDGEIDDDREEDDPAEESEPSGIGDHDGLDEQVPFRDWQGVGMV
jgi:hypothetical protein